MTRLKDATFESNAITGTDAFTSTTGSPTVDGTSKVRGTYSARTNWSSSANVNGTISGLNNSELWFSFYLFIASLPPSGSTRCIRTSNGSTQFNLTITSAGQVNARINTVTLQNNIITVSANTIYRIGLHIKCSSAIGNADAVIDVYAATGDAAFGAAYYSNSAVTMNTTNANFSSLVFGQDNGGTTTGDMYWDSIRVDDTAMPNPDGATDTPKTVSITISSTKTLSKNIGTTKSVSITNSLVRTKNIGTAKAVSIANSLLITKNILKPVALSIGHTLTEGMNIGKTIAVLVTTSVNMVRSFTLLVAQTINTVLQSVRDIQITHNIGINTGILFSKVFGGIQSNIVFRKNIGSLIVELKQSIARVVNSKNTSSISAEDINYDSIS